jgi:hypothetical protein
MDDGTEWNQQMWMGCESCWRGGVYTYVEQRMAKQSAADEVLLDNTFAIKPCPNVPLARHTNPNWFVVHSHEDRKVLDAFTAGNPGSLLAGNLPSGWPGVTPQNSLTAIPGNTWWNTEKNTEASFTGNNFVDSRAQKPENNVYCIVKFYIGKR